MTDHGASYLVDGRVDITRWVITNNAGRIVAIRDTEGMARRFAVRAGDRVRKVRIIEID